MSLSEARFAAAKQKAAYEKEQTKQRHELAMAILPELMKRSNLIGYSDEGAIAEAYRLADIAMRMKP